MKYYINLDSDKEMKECSEAYFHKQTQDKSVTMKRSKYRVHYFEEIWNDTGDVIQEAFLTFGYRTTITPTVDQYLNELYETHSNKTVAIREVLQHTFDEISQKPSTVSLDEVLPYVIPIEIFTHYIKSLVKTDDEKLDRALKLNWIDIAEELGPEYTQGLYHAAVFATKVA